VSLSGKLFWSTLEYVGSGGVIVFFLLFTQAFVHEHQKFSRAELWRLSLLPLLNVLMVATNPWHHWVWISVVPGPPDSNLAIYEHGPGYVWALGCMYLYVLRGIQLLARPILSANVLRRQQALLLLLGSLVPFVSSALYSLAITPSGLNLTPMSFMATGVFFFVALFRMGAFDGAPIAREMLIERLRDGVLVVDEKHRIVDINPRGRSLTGLTADCVGRSLHYVLHDFPELLDNYDKGIESPLELWLNLDTPRYVTAQISSLADYRGNVHGCLIVLHDITERYAAEVELRQANDCLQRQLQEIQFLQAKLQNQANRDQLTGLFNRHYLNENLPQELQRAKAVGYPVGFIMLD
jgi:PAS domain S-box-containing protein